MPFPSGRCKTCRARHLKCDEQRPCCSPCQKSNRECHWDDVDHTSLVFRNENSFASNKAKRQRGGARRPTPAGNKGLSTTAEPSVHVISMVLSSEEKLASNTVRKRKPPKLPMVLLTPESLLLHAHTKFTRAFLQPDGNLSSDIWGFFYRYRHDFSPYGPYPCFTAAFNAYALKYYAQTMQYEPAHDQACQWYSLALLQTRQAVGNESTAHEDEVLMTCLLLSSYDDTASRDPDSISNNASPHLSGAASIVHLRQGKQRDSQRSHELDRVVARRVIRQAVYRGAPVPKDVEGFMLQGTDTVDCALDTYIGRVADLRSQTLDTISTFRTLDPIHQASSTQPLLDLLRSALELDQNLRVWYKNIPRTWTYQERYLSDQEYDRCFPSGILFHKYIHEHQDSAFDGPVSLNRYRAARIVTLSTITRIIIDPLLRGFVDYLQPPILPHYTSQEPTASVPSEILSRYVRSTIYSLTDDMCASIPQFFTTPSNSTLPSSKEEALEGAYASRLGQLVWPLIIVSATRTCPDPQRVYVKKIMGMIAKVTGGSTLEQVSKLDLHLRTAPIVQEDTTISANSSSGTIRDDSPPQFSQFSIGEVSTQVVQPDT